MANGEAMTLMEFVKMVQEVVNETGICPEDFYTNAPSNRLGILCRVNLTADGHVCMQETGIAVKFEVPQKK